MRCPGAGKAVAVRVDLEAHKDMPGCRSCGRWALTGALVGVRAGSGAWSARRGDGGLMGGRGGRFGWVAARTETKVGLFERGLSV